LDRLAVLATRSCVRSLGAHDIAQGSPRRDPTVSRSATRPAPANIKRPPVVTSASSRVNPRALAISRSDSVPRTRSAPPLALPAVCRSRSNSSGSRSGHTAPATRRPAQSTAPRSTHGRASRAREKAGTPSCRLPPAPSVRRYSVSCRRPVRSRLASKRLPATCRENSASLPDARRP